MDEFEEGAVETVGERLRAAREANGLTLEAIAAQTRIPTRHLASLEASDWAALPAPTYSVGFAKNYAAIVGLDRAEIADQLRAEMGGTRPVYAQAEVFQPADPKRSMPAWLIVGAIVAVLVVVAVLSWLRSRELDPAAPAPVTTSAPAATPAAQPALAAPVAAPAGQVTLAALDSPVWIRVRDGDQTLRIGNLAPGERFDLPATAQAPLLDAGRPEGLRITVGGRDVPAIGKSGRPVSKVSLLPADLARGATPPASGAGATAAPNPPAALISQ
ncbi:MAG: helix-turn-helix domain-containing protein [Sphingomicrobium sp.]